MDPAASGGGGGGGRGDGFDVNKVGDARIGLVGARPDAPLCCRAALSADIHIAIALLFH